MMKVLQNKSQIVAARAELVKRGVSCLEQFPRSWMRKVGLCKNLAIGDNIKSWDVLETLDFISKHVPKNTPVLDIGCYASEVPVSLYKMGYTEISGADLNSNLNQMPHGDSINYVQADFMETEFEDSSFNAVTSISVIEHGFDAPSLLKEMSRILCTGGYFIASFDYWPEKIDTSGITFFGMDWRIFSKDDVTSFVELSGDYGFVSVGESHYEGQEMPIDCGGKKYTFGWIVLNKVQ